MEKSIRLLPGIIILIGVISCAAHAKALSAPAFSQTSATTTRITTASGVRVRSAPQTTADEIVRLPIGTVFTELERTVKKETINGVETYWYRLKTAEGKEGWVFGGFTALVNAGGLDISYLSIAQVRLKIENASYADLMDLTEFLARVSPEVTNANRKAEIDLDHLLAMQKMLAAMPQGSAEQPVTSKWLKAHDSEITFSEPCGCWLVRYNSYWDLYKKNSKLPIAEEIAWAAANSPLAGECEGFLECEMGAFNITLGRYLDLYPHGTYVGEALDHLEETLKWGLENMKDPKGIQPGDRPELQKQITITRATVRKTTGAKKQKLLDDMDRIAQHYK